METTSCIEVPHCDGSIGNETNTQYENSKNYLVCIAYRVNCRVLLMDLDNLTIYAHRLAMD